MPVMMPVVGGMPEAIEMPMQSGNATRKTTTEARKSRLQVERVSAAGASEETTVGFMIGRPQVMLVSSAARLSRG